MKRVLREKILPGQNIHFISFALLLVVISCPSLISDVFCFLFFFYVGIVKLKQLRKRRKKVRYANKMTPHLRNGERCGKKLREHLNFR